RVNSSGFWFWPGSFADLGRVIGRRQTPSRIPTAASKVRSLENFLYRLVTKQCAGSRITPCYLVYSLQWLTDFSANYSVLQGASIYGQAKIFYCTQLSGA